MGITPVRPASQPLAFVHDAAAAESGGGPRPPSVQRVRDALAAHQIVTAEVTILDGAARAAAQAAAYLRISPAQIVNSLVFTARARQGSPAEPLLVLTSGAHRVDTIKVADLLELAELAERMPSSSGRELVS